MTKLKNPENKSPNINKTTFAVTAISIAPNFGKSMAVNQANQNISLQRETTAMNENDWLIFFDCGIYCLVRTIWPVRYGVLNNTKREFSNCTIVLTS